MSIELHSLGALEAHAYSGYTYPYYRPQLDVLNPTGKVAPAVAIGASSEQDPVGLGLAAVGTQNNSGQLLSIYTAEAFRRQGVALSILQQLEEELRQRGCLALKVVYEKGRHYTSVIERLLKQAGFPEGTVHSMVCRCHGDRLKEASWLKKSLLPSAFEIIAWDELSEEERDDIIERQKEESWFPQNLTPFQAEGQIEHLNSLALRYQKQIVGWQINHRTAPDTIRYTSMFVREDLQPFGLALPLMIASIRRHIESPESATVHKATFMVPFAMGGMRQFVENRMKPFLDELNELIEISKPLN